MHHDGFSIQSGEKTLFHIGEYGDAINWIDQEATGEERDFVSNEILDPLEKRLKKFPKHERISHNPASINIVAFLESHPTVDKDGRVKFPRKNPVRLPDAYPPSYEPKSKQPTGKG